jgi:hypothetical protein
VPRYGAIAAPVDAVHLVDEENAMIGRLNRAGVATAVSLALAMLAPAALAQTQPAAPQQAPTQGTNAPEAGPAPNDTELKHFADAVVQVQNIRQSLQPQLAAAKTDDARTQLKADAEKKMEAAVTSNQLSLKRYVQIANLVQTDSTVRARVQKLMPPQPQPQS